MSCESNSGHRSSIAQTFPRRARKQEDERKKQTEACTIQHRLGMYSAALLIGGRYWAYADGSTLLTCEGSVISLGSKSMGRT